MDGKPSKEQLEIYFKNSRKYFDSLAEHYKKTDPEYYNSVMKPVMYKNHFSKGSGVSRQKPVLAVVVAVFLAMFGAAVAVFFAVEDSKDANTVSEQKKVEEIKKEKASVDTSKASGQRTSAGDTALSTGKRRSGKNKARSVDN